MSTPPDDARVPDGPVLGIRERLATALRPGADVSPEQGRSHGRYRRAAAAGGVSLIGGALSLVTMLVAVRVVAHATSAQGLGLWLLLVTAVALVGFADFGIGNGLLNVLSEAHGIEDREATREAVASAFWSLTALALALGAIFALVSHFVSWARVFNVTGPTAREAGPATTAFVVCLLVSLPTGVAQRVHNAQQEGWKASLWVALGSVFSLVGVLVASASGAGLAVLVAVMMGGLPLAYLLNSIVLFGRSEPDLRPRVRAASIPMARRVLGTSLMFFLLATVGAVSYEADSLVVSHYLGAAEVRLYAVPFRLFDIAPSVVALVVAPLWPAYGEAIARGDHAWVHRTLRRSLGAALALTVVPSLLLLVAARPVIHVWVDGQITPPLSLLLGLASWTVLNGVSLATAAFSNGAGLLRLQLVIALVMGPVNLALSIVLVNRIGVSGPIWGTVVSQLVIGLVPSAIIMRRLLRREFDADAFRRFLARWSQHAGAEAGVVAP